MKYRSALIWLVASFIVCFGYYFLVKRFDSGDPETPTEANAKSVDSASSSPQKGTEKPEAITLEGALSRLNSGTSTEEAQKILAELKQELFSLPPKESTGMIRKFLQSPSFDAETGIDFAIGPGGTLAGHPSLRVALLDWLSDIDPGQAGKLAKEILAEPGNSDEWAVALRNYARADSGPEGQEFLRTKTEELIRNREEGVVPSVGFFEAFDVFVHTGSTESTGLLSKLVADVTPEGKALAHAAYLTLDRLTLQEPAAMMEELASRPKLTKTRGAMVANLFARADLRDEAQRQHVRDYLLDPDRTNAELRSFAGVYPNANFSISQNLLTENMTLPRSEIQARDEAALNIIKSWLNDLDFESVKPHLLTIQGRLEKFVGE